MQDRQGTRDRGDRTGIYGGDDGALEHVRAAIQPGEDAGLGGVPTGATASSGQPARRHLAGGKKDGPMFARILAAVADDEIAAQVLQTATGLAGTLGAHLALVHVVDLVATVPPPAPLAVEAGPLVTQELVEAQQEASRAFLGRLAAQAVQAETLPREGVPAQEILAAAREWAADLIVVGTHGRGGLGRLVLGSVAEGVLREAPCPVLAVRAGTAPA